MMYRTKRDLDRYVRELLLKLKNEADRKAKGYNISRLYKEIGENECARRYLIEFIDLHPKHTEAHKLLGQIYEALGQKEKALIAYKTSYEIADCQKDLVLKICTLYADIDPENSSAIYWIDEAAQLFPHHNTVIKLRENLMLQKSCQSNDDLEKHYLHEIKANPLSLMLHIKLLKLYSDWSKDEKSKIDIAYKYVLRLEARRLFPSSLEWYQCISSIVDLFENWKRPSKDKNFEEIFLSILDQYIQQSLPSSYGPALTSGCSSFEALNRIKKFDERLLASVILMKKDSSCGNHMINQYYFHLATLLFIIHDNESIFNFDYFVGALLMNAIGSPKKQKIPSNSSDSDLIRNSWYSIGCHRISQAGHLLNQLAIKNGGKKKYLSKIKEICNNERTRQTLHDLLFQSSTESSYILKDNAFGSDLAYVSKNLQLQSDQETAQFQSQNLSELVWLFMQYDDSFSENKVETKFFNFHMFRGVPFASGVNTNAPESLCHLDLVSFIVATAFCQQANDTNFKAGLSKPASLCFHLNTSEQMEWWDAAAFLCKNSSSKRLNRLRSILQNGLEGIRHLSHHLLPLSLTLHLARYFTTCVSAEKDGDISLSEIDAMEERAEHYWNKVLNQCKKSGPIFIGTSIKSRLFELPRSEVTDAEKDQLEEEGQLFLADRMESKGHRQNAIQILYALKSPQASFKRAMLYKKSAKDIIKNFNITRLNLELRNNYVSLLTQARDTFYLTLDRLKMSGVDPSLNSLNKELSEELASVERSLTTASFDGPEDLNLDSTNGFNADNNINNLQPHLELTNGNETSFGICSSTPLRLHNGSALCTPRQEARPSPERLDAQVRHLTEIQQNTIKNVEEHNTALRAQNEALLQTCQTMAADFKQHVKFYKKFLEQKSASEDFSPVTDQLNEIQNCLKTLHIDVRALSIDVGDLKVKIDSKPPSNQIPSVAPVTDSNVPVNITSSAMQGVYNSNYIGYYGQPSVAPSPLIAPIAIFQPPFLPPSTISDQSYIPASSSGTKDESSQSNGATYHMTDSSTNNISSTSLRSALEGSRDCIPPHSFQISLPSSSALSASMASQFDCEGSKKSSSPTFSTEGLLSNVPAPIYSAVATSPDKITSKNVLVSSIMSTPAVSAISGSIDSKFSLSSAVEAKVKCEIETEHCLLSNKSANSNISDHYIDDGHDPCPNYQPVIPLPATVEVVTGEENEKVLFEEKAKLFRYVDKEWRERGLGFIKILHNIPEGTTRVLMRRDQTLKICCNHFINSMMELNTMKENDKVWIWAAKDFADETIKSEKFCCKFKTNEIAQAFKEAFSKAKLISAKSSSTEVVSAKSKESIPNCVSTKEISQSIQPSLSVMFAPPEGSWSCDTCLLGNKSESNICSACKTPNPNCSKASDAIISVSASDAAFKFGFGATISAVPVTTASFTFASKANDFNFGTVTSASSSKPSILFGASSSVTTSVPSFGLGSSVTITATKIPAASLFSNKSTSDSKFSLQGFTFSSTPAIIETVAETNPVKESVTKSEESKKDSIFSNLSFKAMNTATPEPKPVSKIFNLSSTITPETTVSSSAIGGLFSGAINSGPTLTFSSHASNENDTSGIFQIKDQSAFTTKPLFGGSNMNSQVNEMNTTKDGNEDFVPEVDFKPVIPLPDLVDVKTGEEDEQEMLCEHAKLYRFDTELKEWKERGIGNIKLLNNVVTKKVRVLMRRDQTHKVCANHFISPEMNLTTMANSDKAWVWAAKDYADEQVKSEQFAVRFKNSEQANLFKAKFEEAKELIPLDDKSSKQCNMPFTNTLTDLFKPAAGSWECNSCLVMNSSSIEVCIACQATKNGSENSERTTTSVDNSYKFGSSSNSGFSFKDSTTDKSKFSSSFSFGVSTNDNNDAAIPFDFNVKREAQVTPTKNNGINEFTFGSPNKYEFSFSGVNPNSVKSSHSREVSLCESEECVNDEDEDDSLYFEPVIPLPEKINVVTGEEQEEVIFTHRAKLFRMSQGEFKERGLGDVKILQHQETLKYRILMRREQVHKICLNHLIDCSVEFRKKDEKSFYWVATDFSENEPTKETFAIRFKTQATASSFLEAVLKSQNQPMVPGIVAMLPNVQEVKTEENHTSEIINSDSIEITFERKASSDLIQKARELKLPDNFFLYDELLPCTGCRGCDNEDKVEKNVSQSTNSNTSKELSQNQMNESTKIAAAIDLFKGSSTPSAINLFGGKPINPNTPGIFEKSSSLFGGNTLNKVLFSSDTIFSEKNFENDSTSSSSGIFGAGASSNNSIFGGSIENKNIFGGPKSKESNVSTNNSIFTSIGDTNILSLPSTAMSFGDVANVDSSFSFNKSKTPTNSSAWTQRSIFGGNSVKSPNSSQNEEEDYDPQFEPVIPMPDLIEIKTGEEGWEVLFSNRAKTYRYDIEVKQWKERGIGDFKIQYEPSLNKYRLLQRREQVYKLSCNHSLTAEMTLERMATSDVAWCWLATDFSENPQGEVLKLAVKFKTKKIADEFKNVFESSQQNLSRSMVAKGGSSSVDINKFTSAHPDSDDKESDCDDTDEMEPCKMFTDNCILFKNIKNEWSDMGEGEVQIYYDDESYLARVMFHSANSDETKLVDHCISLETFITLENSKSVCWNGFDEIEESSENVRYKAQFESEDSAKAFEDTLKEGKDCAFNSGIDDGHEESHNDLYHSVAENED